ncbi:MAG: hypothetical protein ITG02_11510, partial [Patulibacter sp.]|nr:hypothetical protein [Patulibacter sp.]
VHDAPTARPNERRRRDPTDPAIVAARAAVRDALHRAMAPTTGEPPR